MYKEKCHFLSPTLHPVLVIFELLQHHTVQDGYCYLHVISAVYWINFYILHKMLAKIHKAIQSLVVH